MSLSISMDEKPDHGKPIHGETKLIETKRRDERKRVLCYQHGVLLIRVPYWKRDLKSFISSELRLLTVNKHTRSRR